MDKRDWKRFCELMTTAAEYYRAVPWTKGAMRLAFDLLHDLSIAQVETALSIHASGLNGNCSRFCPNAADLRLALTGTPDQRSVAAWKAVRDALSTVKGGQSVRFDDPRIHWALKACGGWTGLCNAERDMEPVFRRAYITAIQQMISWQDVPDHMPGSDELRGYASWKPEQIVLVKSIAPPRTLATQRLLTE